MENNELVCCGVCEGWWQQACHVPHLYPLPVGDWVCSKCKPVAGATVQVEDDADDAEDEASSTKKATKIKKTIKKTPAKRKLAEGAPDGVQVRRYPRRGTTNYEHGRPEGDGWSHRDLHGLDAQRSRTDAVTWTRIN